MSNPIIVKSIDVSDVRKQLKDCPKDVINYIRSLEESRDTYKELFQMSLEQIKDNNKRTQKCD